MLSWGAALEYNALHGWCSPAPASETPSSRTLQKTFYYLVQADTARLAETANSQLSPSMHSWKHIPISLLYSVQLQHQQETYLLAAAL